VISSQRRYLSFSYLIKQFQKFWVYCYDEEEHIVGPYDVYILVEIHARIEERLDDLVFAR
jgi:hypothetical protein